MQNYRVWCSLNNIPIDDSIAEDGDDDDMDMEAEDDVAPSAGDEALDEEGWGGVMDVDEEKQAGGDDDTPSFFSKETKPGTSVSVPKTQPKRNKTKVALLVK